MAVVNIVLRAMKAMEAMEAMEVETHSDSQITGVNSDNQITEQIKNDPKNSNDFNGYTDMSEDNKYELSEIFSILCQNAISDLSKEDKEKHLKDLHKLVKDFFKKFSQSKNLPQEEREELTPSIGGQQTTVSEKAAKLELLKSLSFTEANFLKDLKDMYNNHECVVFYNNQENKLSYKNIQVRKYSIFFTTRQLFRYLACLIISVGVTFYVLHKKHSKRSFE
jgi:ribonuclease HI